MKAIGLLSLIWGLAALAVQPEQAQAGVRPAFRPPLVAPPGNAHAQNAGNCNQRRFVGGAFYSASWAGDTYAQPVPPQPDAAPPPAVNYIFVQAPAAAPVPERIGPRFIAVDRGPIVRQRGGRPTVIYGDPPF